MVIYSITFIPVVEELWASDMALLVTFYEDDAKFDGYMWRSGRYRRKVFHFPIGRMQHRITHLDRSVWRRSTGRKGLSMGGNEYFSPPSPLINFIIYRFGSVSVF